jgi:hypothetical protein
MPLDPKNWPEVPAGTSRTLPHAGLTKSEMSALEKKGYALADIRLLPAENMAERAQAILSYFEGVRLGLIPPDARQAKIVEIEARACGLQTGKHRPDDTKKLDADDVEALLEVGK